jgi:hypothetical protein
MSRLLPTLLVGLRLLALQDSGVLRSLRVNRLSGKLSTDLLLLLLLSLRSLVMMLLLLLLRPLQDLRGILARHPAVHAWEGRLSVGEVLWREPLGWSLELHLLDRRCASRIIADTLATHGCFDLVQAHQLPGWSDLWSRSRRRRLSLGGLLLLGLQAPDVCARFQLRNIFGVFVALVTSPGFRGLGNRWLVVLRRSLAGLVEHLLFLQDVGDLGCLTRKVKVLVDGLLDGRTPKGVVVEGVVGIIEVVAEAIVRLLEVDAAGL